MMAIDDWFSQVRRSRHPAMQLLKPHPVRSGRWLIILKTFVVQVSAFGGD